MSSIDLDIQPKSPGPNVSMSTLPMIYFFPKTKGGTGSLPFLKNGSNEVEPGSKRFPWRAWAVIPPFVVELVVERLLSTRTPSVDDGVDLPAGG